MLSYLFRQFAFAFQRFAISATRDLADSDHEQPEGWTLNYLTTGNACPTFYIGCEGAFITRTFGNLLGS